MKRIVITIVLVLVGAGAIVYPYVSNYFAEKNSSTAAQVYTEQVAELDKSLCETMWKEAELYNENLTGHPVHDPFIEGTGMAMTDDYAQVLNVDNIMGFIEIPKISLNLPIYHGTAEDTLKKGIGHLEGSTLPIGGKPRHSVITGHTGLTNARMFTDLIELKEGDLFFIHILGETLAYRVDQIKIIEPNVTEDLKRFANKDYVTLLTCTPYGVNSHRLLVRGERVDYIPEIREAIVPLAMTTESTMVIQAAIITSAIMLVLILITFIVTSRRQKHEVVGVPWQTRRGSVTASRTRVARGSAVTARTSAARGSAIASRTRTPKHSIQRARLSKRKFMIPRGANRYTATVAKSAIAESSVAAATSVDVSIVSEKFEPLKLLVTRKLSLCLEVPD